VPAEWRNGRIPQHSIERAARSGVVGRYDALFWVLIYCIKFSTNRKAWTILGCPGRTGAMNPTEKVNAVFVAGVVCADLDVKRRVPSGRRARDCLASAIAEYSYPRKREIPNTPRSTMKIHMRALAPPTREVGPENRRSSEQMS